jgi:hypothetical protein
VAGGYNRRSGTEILDARLIDDINGPSEDADARFPEFIERREVRRAVGVWAHSDREVHIALGPSGAPRDRADDTNLLNTARGRRGTDPLGEAAHRLCQRTWTTATRWIPPGLSTTTSSPARWPEIAAPKGESSEIR